MRKWMALGATCAVAVIAVAAALLAGGGSAPRGDARQGGGPRGPERGERFEVRDPDKDAKPGTVTPIKEAFINRAYPRKYIAAGAVRKATRETRALPTRLKSSQFRTGTSGTAARAAVGADWTFLGPT